MDPLGMPRDSSGIPWGSPREFLKDSCGVLYGFLGITRKSFQDVDFKNLGSGFLKGRNWQIKKAVPKDSKWISKGPLSKMGFIGPLGPRDPWRLQKGNNRTLRARDSKKGRLGSLGIPRDSKVGV